MDYGTISVIITNYNHAKYVGQALESMLSQSYKPYEVIIVDDASTDDSVSIIEEYAKKNSSINFIKNKNNLGPLLSANKALQYVSGDYLYLTAADDYTLPGFFEKSSKILSQYPRAGFSCTDLICLDEATGTQQVHKYYLGESPCYISPDELSKIVQKEYYFITGFTALFRKSMYQRMGKNMIANELQWYFDGFICMVIAFRHGICYLPEALKVWRVLPDSYGVKRLRNYPVNYRAFSALLDFLKSPEYADILPLVKSSTILSWNRNFSNLRIILSNKRFWDFLSFTLIWRVFENEFRLFISRIVPNWLKCLYRYLFPLSKCKPNPRIPVAINQKTTKNRDNGVYNE